MAQPTPSNITCSAQFRPDIEGLRAVAILLVIGGHFAIPGLAAGFVGVDIFFVVSGYLITGILVRESMQQHRINLLRFYANRLRRLFPALATMLVVSSVAAYWILPETQNLAQSKAAAMAAIWLSNLHFTFADVDYFAAETSTNAFVHTWSLGVEEQFYLLWPLLILLVMHLRNGQRAAGNGQRATGNGQRATGNGQRATGNKVMVRCGSRS